MSDLSVVFSHSHHNKHVPMSKSIPTTKRHTLPGIDKALWSEFKRLAHVRGVTLSFFIEGCMAVSKLNHEFLDKVVLEAQRRDPNYQEVS